MAWGQHIDAAAEYKPIDPFIKPYFTPPDSLKDQFGPYNSLLVFQDGSQVKTVQDWNRKREEIKTKWHSIMGEWPVLLKDQDLTIIASEQKDGYVQHHVRFKWLPSEETDGYLLIPDGAGKRPAVVTVYYNPEMPAGVIVKANRPYRDYALQLTKRGFVTLSIGTREASAAKRFSLYYPSLYNAQVQPLSMLAYAAANAWHVLARRPEVDKERIGIIGHSFGGKWAMFASCLFEKFACAVWSDPGIVFDETKGSNVNYWEPWYLGYYPPPWDNVWRKTGMIQEAKGIYPKLVREGWDLHELHALMAPRPFLVSGGSSDQIERWAPLNHTIQVNELLGYKNRVAMHNRPLHPPNENANEVAYRFLEYFLK
ncbi:alpha/beta hydrolase [Parapedobacter sp. SGR-10]|nr:alpha/beta hydrolase [Parapedobacter sp. SGR-10]